MSHVISHNGCSVTTRSRIRSLVSFTPHGTGVLDLHHGGDRKRGRVHCSAKTLSNTASETSALDYGNGLSTFALAGSILVTQVQVMRVNVSILVMSERSPPSTIRACVAATHRPTLIQLPSSSTSLRIPATRSVFSSYCCWGCLGRIADQL